MGCTQSKPVIRNPGAHPCPAKEPAPVVPPWRSLIHGDADVTVQTLPGKQAKALARSSTPPAGSSSPSYEDSRGNRHLSPTVLNTLNDYFAHWEVRLGRHASPSAEAELTSQALPDTYVPAPRPRNEEQRQATVDAVGIVGAPPNPYLYNLCRLAAQTYSMPLVFVLIADKDALQSSAFHGLTIPHNQRGDRDSSMCVWGLGSDADMVIVEDVLLDLRFLRHESSRWPKPIRFLACAPLTASNGYRIGYLVLTDFRPRIFEAGMYHLVANLAALAMQEIEGKAKGPLPEPEIDSACKFSRQSMSTQAMLPGSVELLAGPGAPQGTLICDFALQGWPLLHSTSACAGLLGEMPLASCMPSTSASASASSLGSDSRQQLLWQLFGQPDDLARVAAQLQHDRHPRVVVMPGGGSLKAPEGMRYKLIIHSPMQDWPAQYGPVTGIPPTAYLLCNKAAMQLCMVEVLLVRGSTSQPGPTPRLQQQRSDTSRQAMAEKDVILGSQIGRGGYGKVYHSMYKDQDVAVKVIMDQPMHGSARVNIEQDVATDLQHSNIIGTIAYFKHEVPSRTLEGMKGGPQRAETEHWIVMELCTRGSLQMAYERGWFQSAISKPGMTASPLAVLVATAAEIAAGMAYLHSQNILHGDLTAGNVLLAANDADFRGFTAKVADFGLSRFIHGQQITTTTHGTVTHMPPELLVEGTLSKAGDTYAFGCLLWSMITGSQPWPNSSQMQVMMKVTLRGESLQVPETAPSQLRGITTQCLHRQPQERPTFQALQAQLQDYYQQICKDDALASQPTNCGTSRPTSTDTPHAASP